MTEILDYQETADRPDLRRAHAAALRRAEFLEPPDRMLARLMLTRNATHRQIAGVLGIDPGTVCRRVCKLANRLYDPLVVRLIDRPAGLRPEYRTLGIEYFLMGRSINQLADLHQMSRMQVRAIVEMLRVWHRA